MFTKQLGAAVLIVILLQIFTPGSSDAQEPWQFSAPVYLWGAGLNGHIGAFGRSVEIDQSFSDILSNLHFGFMGGFRAYRNEWAITTDVIFVSMGAAATNGTDVDVDQFILSGDVGYQVSDAVEVLAGARIVSIGNSLDFQAPNLPTLEADKTWVDPVIGIRFAPQLSESWSLWTRFDLGGFGMGSDFTWNVSVNAVYSISDRTAFTFGYRVLDIDYDDDDAVGEFEYDASQQGPMAGVVFSF